MAKPSSRRATGLAAGLPFVISLRHNISIARSTANRKRAATRGRKPSLRRIPRARKDRQLERRVDVTRAEYNYIIDILNQRGAILNEFRDAIHHLQHAGDIQLKRIAQIQADIDAIRRAWQRLNLID